MAEGTQHISRTNPEAQGVPGWHPPSGTLARILDSTRVRVRSLLGQEDRLAELAAARPVPLPFAAAISGRSRVAVIAELKKRSPSRGALNPELDVVTTAVAYQGDGAAALSVLTEPEFFGGSVADLSAVAEAVTIPVLRKDFIVHPLQVIEARAYGASAVLLICRGIPPGAVLELAALAREHGMSVLAEVRSESELQTALQVPGVIVGVNSRNLETLEVDADLAARLVRAVPSGVPAVFESGIRSGADVRLAAAAGADAVLVGSALSLAAEPGVALREMCAVAKGYGIRRG